MQRNQNTIILLLCALNFTHVLDFMILMPLGNFLIPSLHLSSSQFALLVGAYPISAAISSFTSGFFVDKFDRKKILLIGYTGFIIGTLGCGLAQNFYTMLAARFFAGLLGGVTYSQVLAILSDIFPYEKRGKALGKLTGASAIASTLGIPFALYLTHVLGWRMPFFIVTAIGIITLVMAIKYLPVMANHVAKNKVLFNQQSKMAALTNIISNPRMRLTLLFSGLVMLGHYLIIPFINPVMEFNMGFSKTATPLVYLVGGTASFFAGSFLGTQADKYGKLKIFTLCVLCSIPLIITLTNIAFVPFSMVVFCFAIWFSTNSGRGVSSMAMISNTIPPEQRGSFMSFNSCVQQLGTFVATVIAGNIVKTGVDGRIENFALLGLLSVGVLIGCLFLAQYLFANVAKKESIYASLPTKSVAA
jgi:MFS transporter, DHA1 family, inner membrane transport protein